MTLIPNSTLYAAVGRERQARFRARGARPPRRPIYPVRVRIGRTLISIGTKISGDCIELRARRTARQPHAA